MSVTDNMSKSNIQKISGFKKSQILHFILIGQLGKYILCKDEAIIKTSEITSKEILDFAFEVIYASHNLIPCRCVLVECRDVDKIKAIYESYGFSYFQQDDNLFQYIKQI